MAEEPKEKPLYSVDDRMPAQVYRRLDLTFNINNVYQPPLGLVQMFAATPEIKIDEVPPSGKQIPVHGSETITANQVRRLFPVNLFEASQRYKAQPETDDDVAFLRERFDTQEQPSAKPEPNYGFVLPLTDALWRELNIVNQRVNKFIHPLEDHKNPMQGGRIENWIYFVHRDDEMDRINRKADKTGDVSEKPRGDCDEYTLTKLLKLRKYFKDNGLPMNSLFITVVKEQGEDGQYNVGHVFLTVNTDRGAFVLDNQHGTVVPLETLVDSGRYQLVSHQSNIQQGTWVGAALEPEISGDRKPEGPLITGWGNNTIPANTRHKPQNIITQSAEPKSEELGQLSPGIAKEVATEGPEKQQR